MSRLTSRISEVAESFMQLMCFMHSCMSFSVTRKVFGELKFSGTDAEP